MSKIQRALMVLAACAALGAQAAPTITFDAYDSTTLTSTATHVEGGFQLSGDALTVIGTDWSAFYSTGSNSMISNRGDGTITLSKVGGGAFAFNMIDVSELGNSGNLSATNVHFIGQLSAGGTADVTIGLDLVFGNQTVDFGALFASVTSVSAGHKRAPITSSTTSSSTPLPARCRNPVPWRSSPWRLAVWAWPAGAATRPSSAADRRHGCGAIAQPRCVRSAGQARSR